MWKRLVLGVSGRARYYRVEYTMLKTFANRNRARNISKWSGDQRARTIVTVSLNVSPKRRLRWTIVKREKSPKIFSPVTDCGDREHMPGTGPLRAIIVIRANVFFEYRAPTVAADRSLNWSFKMFGHLSGGDRVHDDRSSTRNKPVRNEIRKRSEISSGPVIGRRRSG